MPRLRWPLELKYLAEYLLVLPLVSLIRRLSEPIRRALARRLARVAYRVLGHDRKWCLRNLELIFGDHLTAGERTKLAIRAFENLLLTLAESARWSPDWMRTHVIEEGGEACRAVAREAREAGKGCIIISAHLGNFELIPAWVYYTGWRGPVMYRPQDNWRVEQLLLGARREYLQDLVPRGPLSLMPLMYALREGQGVGLLIDINTIVGAVHVDFLGFQAATPPGAAALALATRCPVILAVSVRQADGQNRLIFHPPFPLIDTGDRKRDIVANTAQYMKAIEPYVLAHPEQYNWLHPRWRFRPDGSVWKLSMAAERQSAERTRPPLEPYPAVSPAQSQPSSGLGSQLPDLQPNVATAA